MREATAGRIPPKMLFKRTGRPERARSTPAAARDAMTQQETRSDKATLWGFAGARSDELGHRIDVMIEMQVEIFDTLEEITRNWFARAKSEARLASELSTKLATARSLPDSASAYQEWLSRWMEMMTDDGRRS